jgi:hypothetical protein
MTITILDVMSDFTSIRTLLSVSCCSKLANQTTKQLIDRKTENAQEMRQLVLDIFPTMKNLPMAECANYYRVLLETYFAGKSRHLVRVSHSIGGLLQILSYNPYGVEIARSLRSEIRSSSGRKQILAAVQEWRYDDENFPRANLHRLQAISDIARLDFSITGENVIGTSFCR